MSASSSRRQRPAAASPKKSGGAMLLALSLLLLLLTGIGYALPSRPQPVALHEEAIEMAGNGKGEWRLLPSKRPRANMDEKICEHLRGHRYFLLLAGLAVGLGFLLLWQRKRKQESGEKGTRIA